ncbi:hypothetical protein D915_002251 [Fasciola hepatica]|uniref:Dymeclin n=1 Tax=Fasciola hepatica TaxID=6192 RepID=A0A4E0S365_FASHE|nr:hypothetical protein D915_002251 [Fasciola hepatica]
MGARSSSLQLLSSNEWLRGYVGQHHIPHTDPFWKEFLGPWLSGIEYNIIENLDELDSSVLRQFKRHNVKTHNLAALAHFIITNGNVLAATKYSDHSLDSYRELYSLVQNAILVFRISSKYLMEASSEQAFLKHLSDDPNEVTECPLLANFFHTIFLLLIRIPVNSETYALHCEILTTALVLFAGQMHRPLASPLPLIFAYAIWGKCAQLAPAVVHRLLTNFSENLPAPPGLMGRPAQSSFMWRAASSLAGGLLTVVTLGYANRGSSSTTATQQSGQSEQDPNKSNTAPSTDLITSESVNRTGQGCNVLAEQSTLLLLVLTTQAGSISRCAHLPQELGLEAETPTLNPYRMALFSLRDNKQNKPHASRHNANVSEPSAKAVPKSQPGGAMLRGIVSTENPELDAFPVDFTALRDIAAQTMHQDSSTLLLYLLVHRNTHFQEFLLQNQNYEKLLLPLLNVLYRSPADSTHLVYMALIIILILTENEKFGQEIHTSVINWVDWSPSRRLTSISRGSLIILVLIRTIRYHLNQLKDKYLHVNILAALANLSAKVKNLHPHVSDSFLCLLQLLTKRYNRTVEQLQNLSAKSTDAIDDEVSVDAPVDKANTTAPTTNTVASTNASDENEKNSTEESVIQELSLLEEVIRMILEILNSILTHVLLDNSNLIYSLLHQRECLVALRSHPSFQKFPDLKFKYVEEESPDDFFIPYVWSVVLRQSGIAFRADRLRLFSPESESAVSDGKAGDVDPDADADNENELSTGTPTTTTVATASTSATMRTEKAIGGVAV